MYRLFGIAVGFTLLTVFTGCSESSVSSPVTGVVKTTEGVPCEGALVVFHPQEEERLSAKKPVATCDSNGNFSLTTDQPDDGAEPGKYGVTIVWIQADSSGGGLSLSSESGGGSDRLKSRYGRPETPEFFVDVTEGGPNEFTFEVEE